MTPTKEHLRQGGRIVIPANYGKALGLKPGEDVVFIPEGNEARLIPSRQAVKRSYLLVCQYVSTGHVLANALINDCRQEVRLEIRKRTASVFRP